MNLATTKFLREIITETLLTLCHSPVISTTFPDFKIDALIGLTLKSTDNNTDDNVVLINIHQDIKSSKTKHRQTPNRKNQQLPFASGMPVDYSYLQTQKNVSQKDIAKDYYTHHVNVKEPSNTDRCIKVEQKNEACDLSTPPRSTLKLSGKKSIDKIVGQLSVRKEREDESSEINATPIKNSNINSSNTSASSANNNMEESSPEYNSERTTPAKSRSSKRKAMPTKNLKSENEDDSSSNTYTAFNSIPVFPGHDFNDNAIEKVNVPSEINTLTPPCHRNNELMDHDNNYSPDRSNLFNTFNQQNQISGTPEMQSDSSPEDSERFRKHLSPGKNKPAFRQLRMYACKQCNKTFNHSSHLKDHIRIHTGEKPFACQVCRKGFRQKQHLKKHLQVHKEDGMTCNNENPNILDNQSMTPEMVDT